MYRAILLPFVAAALIITTVNALLHPTASPRLASNSAATKTPAAAAAAAHTTQAKSGSAEGGTPAPTDHVLAALGAEPSVTAGTHVPVAATRASGSPAHVPAAAIRATAATHVPAAVQAPAPRAVGSPETAVPGRPSRAFAAAGPPASRIRLPSGLTSLPTRADVYSLQYARFPAAGVAKIVATFPGLLRTSPDTYRSSAGSDLLTLDGSSPSRITYTHAGSAATSVAPVTALVAARTARDWLAEHRLIPAGVNLAQASTTYSSSSHTVEFRPRAPRGLSGIHMPAGISVVLDAAREVTAASVSWPSLGPGRSTTLVGPAQALASAGGAAAFSAPTGSTVVIDSVSVAYEQSGRGKTLTWQPVYRFAGHIDLPGSPRRQVVRNLPAAGR